MLLDALEQALYDRRESVSEPLVHHSDRGSTCPFATRNALQRRGSSRLWGAAAIPTTNALAESVIGLYKTEVIRRRGSWRALEEVDYATLEWVDWYNTKRLLEPIGYVPRHSSMKRTTISSRRFRPQRRNSTNLVSGEPGAVNGKAIADFKKPRLWSIRCGIKCLTTVGSSCSHGYRLVPEVEAELAEALEDGLVDLAAKGHLHACQVELPFEDEAGCNRCRQ